MLKNGFVIITGKEGNLKWLSIPHEAVTHETWHDIPQTREAVESRMLEMATEQGKKVTKIGDTTYEIS